MPAAVTQSTTTLSSGTRALSKKRTERRVRQSERNFCASARITFGA